MKRGDIVIIATPGAYGKPRPAVIIQSDALSEAGLQSLAVCLITSNTAKAPLFRLQLEPNPENGLEKPSQIMTEKLFTLPAKKVQRVIGSLSSKELTQLNRCLTLVIGIT